MSAVRDLDPEENLHSVLVACFIVFQIRVRLLLALNFFKSVIKLSRLFCLEVFVT